MIKMVDFIVSSRPPVSIVEREGRVTLRQNDGGLVSGLNGVHVPGKSIWLGALTMTEAQNAVTVSGELTRRGLQFVIIPDELYTKYYEGWCNGALWPLHHYREDSVILDASAWESYVEVNRLFAAEILKQANHFMLLPRMLREERPNLKIGFFLHIPFPSWETFRILPQRREIIEGLLGADLVGFHTMEYAQYCADAVEKLLADAKRDANSDLELVYDDRHIRLGPFPMGIDAQGVFNKAHSDECEVLLADFQDRYRRVTVSLGIDRLDYSKGLPQRILAIGEFFEHNPEYIGKVVFIQIAVPTREAVGEYQRIRDEVDRLVGNVNGKFGRAGYVPIHYRYQSIPSVEVFAYYRLASLLIVSALRDGLNVVAKEYVAAKGNEEPGVLLLSEFAGSSIQMDKAILVHPWDIGGMASAIERGISMLQDEQIAMMESLYGDLLENNNIVWSTKFLNALDEVHSMNQ
jgi:trehalose 6-phosphate synthase/phosphatase